MAAAIDKAAQAAIAAGESPGLQVAVFKNGAPVLVKGYGSANLELKVPVDNDSVFRVGSVTKQFTAAALLKLQEEGKLSLGDTLSKYYPQYPRAADITLAQMLHHTSGLHSYTDDADLMEREGTLRLTTDQWVERFARMPTTQDFEPGTSWHYSDTAYFVLGGVIEKVQGKPLASVFEERFFGPLGMTHTALDDEKDIAPGRVAGYDGEGPGTFKNAGMLSMTIPGAAGSMRSSATDLSKWNAALFGGSVLEPASFHAMITPGRLNNGELSSTAMPKGDDPEREYGYGLAISRIAGHTRIGHGGGIPGFSASLQEFPDDHITVAVIANSIGKDVGVAGIAQRIERIARGQPAQDTAGGVEQGIFRIKPLRPVAELRAEAMAAQPPKERGTFRAAELVDLTTLDPTIKLDIRYATANNFLSTPLYERPRAVLQRPAAEALARAHRALMKQGYGLLIHDAYRPWWVTKVFWEATPAEWRKFVADPAQGSRHNRGCAVDLTLYDLKTGEAVQMPGVYDEMSERSYPSYMGGTREQRRLRDLLRATMEREGFAVYETEWWHFDFKDWQQYPILNVPFEALDNPSAAGERYDYDLVIRNGRVLDGQGNPWVRADLAIKDGRFARIGHVEGRGRREIDASNDYVSPGWIDMMDQSGEVLLKNGFAENKLRQGITTAIAGEGGTPVPSAQVADYLSQLQTQGISINFGTYYGAGQARVAAMGDVAGKPTTAQMEKMKAHVAEAMRGGAMGIATALIYPPDSFQSTEDLIELARVAARYDGIYASHMRDESAKLLEAVRESIEIGEQSGIQVEIFHFKGAYAPGWGKLVPEAGRLIEAARARGVNIAADMYVYPAGGTGLEITVPNWVFEQGVEQGVKRLKDPKIRERLKKEVAAGSQPGWSNLVEAAGGWQGVVLANPYNERYDRYRNRSLESIGKELGRDPADVAWDILLEALPNRAYALFFVMSEPDIETALKFPWMSIGSDAGAAEKPGEMDAIGLPHPRAYGNAVRVIAEYVKKRNVLTLEDAIRKMTSWPATRMRLYDRGAIREGLRADLTIFNYERLDDVASFDNPMGSPTGIDYVLLNGQLVIDQGRHTGAKPGSVLRGGGYQGQK